MAFYRSAWRSLLEQNTDGWVVYLAGRSWPHIPLNTESKLSLYKGVHTLYLFESPILQQLHVDRGETRGLSDE